MSEATSHARSVREPMSLSDERPVLRIVRGDPSDEELAALVAVLTARATAKPGAAMPSSASSWADPQRCVRSGLRHGPGAWRASALPQ
jgi:Acyl-CoA carboxylase epsilon subunit